VVEARGGDASLALSTFDFTNALNEVSRQKILDIVQEKYPDLYPYVKMCYAKTSHVWWDGHRMMSAWGIQQGDPLGPLLFCLAIHRVLTEVANQVVAEFLTSLKSYSSFSSSPWMMDTSLPSMRP
jgi:hypothetical protein